MGDNRVMTRKPVDQVAAVVASQLRNARINRGMTQQAVADLLGEHVNQYQRRETGMHRMGATELHKLMIIMNVDASYFFQGLPNDQP